MSQSPYYALTFPDKATWEDVAATLVGKAYDAVHRQNFWVDHNPAYDPADLTSQPFLVSSRPGYLVNFAIQGGLPAALSAYSHPWPLEPKLGTFGDESTNLVVDSD